MQATVALPQDLALAFADRSAGPQGYATSHLQRGLLLLDRGASLSEEAVGFGVPVLKRGLQTIFPGGATLDVQRHASTQVMRIAFRMNRVERLSRPSKGIVGGAGFYAAKDLLAATIRRWPASRLLLTAASSGLRRAFGWETAYTDAGFQAVVEVSITIEPPNGRLLFELDCSHLPADITEVVLMHEQGGHSFDRYEDNAGLQLQGEQIGCWDEVRASRAWFESTAHRVAFRLGEAKGATLFRGREVVGSRLAWAGFGYSFQPPLTRIVHEMTILRPA